MFNTKDEISLSNEEFSTIARGLDSHHAVFSTLWNLGKPTFTNLTDTAMVSFEDNNENRVNFYFNPSFWNELTEYERNFVICHECLHVILGHGARLKSLLNGKSNASIAANANIAADIVVNHMLTGSMGFDRTKLVKLNKNGCWVDIVFKETDKIEKDRCLEYYYNLLNKLDEQSEKTTIDDHSNLSGTNIDGSNNNLIEDLVDDVIRDLSQDDMKSFSDMVGQNKEESNSQQRGTIAGNITQVIKLTKVITKKKWETVINKWAQKQIKDSNKDHEQWARTNRRFNEISLLSNLFLPSEMEVDEREQEETKIKVVFFQDTSGSCRGFAKRFFTAAASLPKDKFDIDLYCFDTQVYKTSLESGKLYGFGGTSFSILESYVWNNIAQRDEKKYPKAIFVITDGYGDNINPRIPKKWYWFLSSSYRSCISNKCNIFKLSDFE